MALKMRITVNGQTYTSVNEMPPDARRQYEQTMSSLSDRDANGVGDIFEGRFDTPEGAMNIMATTHRYVVNGTEYSKWDELPPHIQKLLTQAGKAPKPAPATVPSPDALHERMRRLDERPTGITLQLSWGMATALACSLIIGVIVLAWAFHHH